MSRAPAERCLPWLLLLFVGSGCAALIYEIVWFQLVELVIGSSAVSLGVLLAAYMGGMCVGSVVLPRLVSTARHPLRVYAVLELGIGAIGLVLLWLIPLVARAYLENALEGAGSLALRGALCAVLLLPPTVLMGATLPAVARWVESTPRGMSWLGFFYGGNIAGAVVGSLAAGFYLLRVYDLATATLVAVSINIAVAAVALLIARAPAAEYMAPAQPEAGVAAPQPASVSTIHLCIALSGMTALAAEVVWTRLLSLLLGATVYTFSIILGVFLAGLGIGSAAGAGLARGRGSAAVALGWCQLLLAAAIAWAGFMVTRSLPFWRSAASADPWSVFGADLLRCAIALLPAACLWGASFPLALAAAARPGQDAGRTVGAVYALNTVGAIVGAVGTSVLLIRGLGTQHTQQLLMACSVLSGLILLAPTARDRAVCIPPGDEKPSTFTRLAPAVALVAAAGLVAALGSFVAPVPWQLVAYGRFAGTTRPGDRPVWVGEGMNASVAVTLTPSDSLCFHVSGKVEASSDTQDMRLQRMLGHLPALLHPKPESVLVVGCGAGVTAGSFVIHPSVKRIVICELEPLIPQVVARHFGKQNYDVLKDPRVHVVYDDARHYILTTREKFDIITSDPIHPWVKGAATLYTQEYFELCKRRLKPGGLVTQWVPLYESTMDVVKSEIGTFFRAFPYGSVWSNDYMLDGYDVVLLGQAEPYSIDADRLHQRLEQPAFARVKESLREVGLSSAYSLLSTYSGRASDLRPWLRDAQINRDGNLRLQYLAGMGLNVQMESSIYDDMLAHRRFPEGLLVGSKTALAPLRKVLKPGGVDPEIREWMESGLIPD